MRVAYYTSIHDFLGLGCSLDGEHTTAWLVLIVWHMWIELGYQMGTSTFGLIAIEGFCQLTIVSGTRRTHLERA